MNGESFQNRKPGPAIKLSLQQEFLLVLIKLRLRLTTEDLAFDLMCHQAKFHRLSLLGYICCQQNYGF